MHADPHTEEYLLPQLEALMAGTLALMTGLCQSSGPCAHRALMQTKVRDNLSELAAHPQLSATLRQVLTRLLGHWATAAGREHGGHELARTHGLHSPALLH